MPAPNRLFTGRAAELATLHTTLQTRNAALTPTLAALHGMGGVGKTHTAAQYVHLHKAEYAVVVWTRAETPADFKAQLANLAPLLDASIVVQPDQDAMFQSARQWLNTQGDWLLVIDNAENLPELDALLPDHATGRILLTTRERVPPNMADSIEIHHLDDATGATLLLRRAGTLKPGQELDAADTKTQADAKAVSEELGGLALALDQAGAYMHERTLSLAAYLDYYHKRHQQLHKDYKSRDHASVSVTFDLALQQVRRIPKYGKAAVELARLCAFLAPDPIPDEVFTDGKVRFGNWFTRLLHGEPEYVDVCEAATRYALLRRTSDPPGLWMHRLAQEVVRDSLSEEDRKTMVEQVMLAVNAAFPIADFPTWPLCARLLPHALACIQHIEEHALHTTYASRLLGETGGYLCHRARYAGAEPLLVQSLAIRRQVQGEEHKEVATACNNLGMLYRDMGRYEDAASYLEQAVALARRVLGEEDAGYATYLDNLAGVYYFQRRLEEALPLWEQALAITRRALGLQHPDVAIRLNSLAAVYTRMGRYEEAVPLYVEALAIGRATIGETAPYYATGLVNLASLYIQSRRSHEAAPLLTQALSICTQAHGSQHPHVAQCHYMQGRMYCAQGNLMPAADALRQAWEIWERMLGPQHPDTVDARKWLDYVQPKLDGEGG